MNNSKKTLRFLAVSLIAVSLLCVCIFSFLARSEERRVGKECARTC